MFRFIILFLFLAIAFSLFIYQQTTQPLKIKEDKAIQLAKEKTSLKSVDKLDWFHYFDAYYVIQGKNDNNENIIIWVPDDKDKEIIVKKANEGLSEEEVISLLFNGIDSFQDEKRPKEIINIKLGMIEDVPVYEVTYRDQKNRYSFLYIDFYEGSWYRVYNL